VSNAAGPDQLDVFFGEEAVGTLFDSEPLSFEYAESWLSRSPLIPLANIELSRGQNHSNAVAAFFENLLPEGELRDYIASSTKSSTVFSLLRQVAGDTAGGFVILPAGERPQPPSYKPTSWEALGKLLSEKSAAAVDIKSKGVRVSLAGAQDKANIAIFEGVLGGRPQLPLGTSPSTHILKPDIRRLAKVWHSAANETLMMRTAALCGLPTASVFYEPLTQACVVERFDRFVRPDGDLGRLIQYDLCQLSGLVSDKKYEKEGGPGAADCAKLIRRYSAIPAVDLKLYLGWIFFNLYTGNNDSHAKNLSVYRLADGTVRLTPFYDLMCTRVYPGLSQEFAFAIGGEVMPGKVGEAQLVQLAKDLGMSRGFVLSTAKDLAARLPDALATALAEVSPNLPPAARTLVKRVQDFVLTTTRQMDRRFRSAP
jgi:serine/threonine-protein kinase HipA